MFILSNYFRTISGLIFGNTNIFNIVVAPFLKDLTLIVDPVYYTCVFIPKVIVSEVL